MVNTVLLGDGGGYGHRTRLSMINEGSSAAHRPSVTVHSDKHDVATGFILISTTKG